MKFEDIEFRLRYLISQRNEKTIGVQLGVGYGLESLRLLKECSNLILNCIDPWDQRYVRRYNPPEWHNASEPCHMEPYDNVSIALKAFADRSKIIKGFYDETSYAFGDGSLDFVFINNNTILDEEIEFTQNLMLWIPKIKNDGMLCGRRWGKYSEEDKIFFTTKMEYHQFEDGSWTLSAMSDEVRKWAIENSKRQGDWNESGFFEENNTDLRPF